MKPRTLATVAVTVLVAVLLAACSGGRREGTEVPKPAMVMLAERNRMVWLSDEDDDQLTITRQLWDTIDQAARTDQASTVTSETVNAVFRTGGAAGFYFREGELSYPDKPLGVIVVLEPGEAGEVRSGDILHMYPKAVYRTVARLDRAELNAAEDVVYHRMGLR